MKLKLSNKNETDKIINKDKIKYIILIIWEILSIICVVYIQYFLRSQNTLFSPTETFLLGTLPSFFGASAFVAVLFIYHKIHSTINGSYQLMRSIVIAVLITFFGFLFWEVIRMGLYPFDVYDILMTFFGCLISTILILTLFNNDFN